MKPLKLKKPVKSKPKKPAKKPIPSPAKKKVRWSLVPWNKRTGSIMLTADCWLVMEITPGKPIERMPFIRGNIGVPVRDGRVKVA